MVLHNYFYRRWFRPYQNEIEAYRFFCKFITLYDLPEDALEGSLSESTVSTFVAMHKDICAEAETRRGIYTERLAAGDPEMAEKQRQDYPYGLNPKFYLVQPLFRALLVIVDLKDYDTEDSATVGRLPVSLVRTGIEDGLSSPITFKSIAAKIDGYAGETQAVVETDLETAVDFILGLEEREHAVFGSQPDTTTAVGLHRWENIEQEWREEWGESLVGPSSQWVDPAQFPV
ncbi:hypothetical protein C8A01DRAFT_40342 [Parachaetomium inaequale]|uniref:Uncharacterized protein n=1 Tax=Parachaetomium inaequale TaxID=2588326 RepID=A0AAN6P7K2_9PEZI|nr:hypothetical protein C8A01DRAFT_40342 [Parachaetomium inaequale]